MGKVLFASELENSTDVVSPNLTRGESSTGLAFLTASGSATPGILLDGACVRYATNLLPSRPRCLASRHSTSEKTTLLTIQIIPSTRHKFDDRLMCYSIAATRTSYCIDR